MPTEHYIRRFRKRLARELGEFAKAQLLVGFLVTALILSLQYHLGLISKPALRANMISVLTPYFVVFVLFAIYHGYRTTYLLDRDAQDKIRRLGGVIEGLERPELYLQYENRFAGDFHCSGFFLRTENDRKACNIEISSEDTVGDGHVKLGMRWESPGHPIGRGGIPVGVRCVYERNGQFATFNSVTGDQIGLFFDHKKNNPRELIVSLNYTDVGGRPCPTRMFKVSQDMWNNRKISCEPVQNQGVDV